MRGRRFINLLSGGVSWAGGVPGNALLDENGLPLLDENGAFILAGP